MTRPAPTVTVPVETQECARLLVQELAPDQGQTAGRAFGLAVALQSMLAAAPAAPQAAGVGAKSLGQQAFEAMRAANTPRDMRDWSDLTAEQRDRWNEDASERPHLYGLRAPSREPEGGAVLKAENAPIWADGIVTDGERVAMAQKAEADYGGTYWAVDGGDGGLDWEPTHFISLTALATRAEAPAVPDDVQRLVNAARVVAFEDQGPDAIKALDVASEAFADRVPWENEPSEEAPALENPDEPSAPENARDWTGEEAPAETGGLIERLEALDNGTAAKKPWIAVALAEEAAIALRAHPQARSGEGQ